MNSTRQVVIYVLLAAIIVQVPLLLLYPSPEGAAAQQLNTIQGFMMGLATLGMNWLFGSTEGSKAKNDATQAALSTAVDALGARSATDGAAGGTLKTENVSVEADTATVTTGEKRDSLREKFV
jgi:hypothetical protein